MANVQIIGFGIKETDKLFRYIRLALSSLGFDENSAIVSAIYQSGYAEDEQKEGIHVIGYLADDNDAHRWSKDAFLQGLNVAIIDSETMTAGAEIKQAPYFSVFAETPERIEEIVAHMKAHGVGMDTEKHLIRPDAEVLEYPCIRVPSDIEAEFAPIIEAIRDFAPRIYKKEITFTWGSEMS
jgi:hypothetical protein